MKEPNRKSKTKYVPSKPDTSVESEIEGSGKWNNYLLLFTLLITFIVYARVIWFDFLYWDEDLYIILNDSIKDLQWSNIKSFFTSFYAGNYQPITILSYAIEYKIVGESAWLFHLDNII